MEHDREGRFVVGVAVRAPTQFPGMDGRDGWEARPPAFYIIGQRRGVK